MLKFLRKRENVKKIMWGLALVIIPAFVLWGAGSATRSGDRAKYAGRIFGKKVSFEQYRAAFLACKNEALLIYGENFNQMAKFLNLENKAWERLIQLNQVRKEKIGVSDKEVIGFIQNLPFFQKEGRFNQERYKLLLEHFFHTDLRDFEEQIRESLKLDKLRNRLISKVGLSDEEIEELYKNEHQLAKASFVLVEPQSFKDQVHPAYEELEQYYQEHKAEFKKPEQVNVQYIALYFDRDLPPAETNEEELKEALEDKIWQLADEIGDDPASFEDTAKQNQLEVRETGFFGPQDVIAEIGLSYEFLNAAFTLKLDQISNVIETPKGYFVIKIKEKKEPHIPALDKIKEAVEEALTLQKSRELAQKKAQDLASQLKQLMEEKALSFARAAEKLTLNIEETEKFSRISYIPGIGQSPEFARAAFALKPGSASDAIAVPNGYCILSLKEIIPIDEEKFAQEKEEFAKELLERKKDVFYKIWLAGLKKKANLEDNIAKLKTSKNP